MGIDFPKNQAAYQARLVQQKKEIYKNPAELPPNFPKLVKIEEERQDVPKRAANDDLIFKDHPEFVPNRTPEEVLRGGAFGGTYFRPITSAVTNISYKSADVLADTVRPEWIEGLGKATMLTSMKYRVEVNKHGAKCGGSLGMWESSGWMADCDPYGWFQWYCRFYQGRRTSDDPRQIQRFNNATGPRGRFRNQLLNKILAAKADLHDNTISPVIRQVLFHWGWVPTEEYLELRRRAQK